MENLELKETKEYTNGDILKVLGKMPENESAVILACLSIPRIRDILNDEKEYENYCNNVEVIAKAYRMFADVFSGFKETVDALLVDNAKDISSSYDNLPETEKKKTALELLNNTDFQKNCCDILVRDYERIVAEDSTCNALDKLLGISKYFRKCIETGLGCDHEYEVE